MLKEEPDKSKKKEKKTDNMEEERSEDITCGFLEDVVDKSECESQAMPSKVGCLPAWLALDKLPRLEDLECPECHTPMMFLLQLNSPLDDVNPAAYYRMLYVFCCKSCVKFRAFRCQLPRENTYYTEKEEDENEGNPTVAIKADAPRAQLCDVCGCNGTKTCARCHRAHYCTQFHQKIAWQDGHSKECTSLASSSSSPSSLSIRRIECDCSCVRFPERIIVSEDEPTAAEAEAAAATITTKEMEEKIKKAQRVKAEADETAEDEAPEYVDMEFLNFQRRLERAPQQVLRYIHGNVGCPADEMDTVTQPLWCSSKAKPESVPPCPLCGAPRVPEFQITPQLIYLEKVSPDSAFDFGTVVVYTCAATCAVPGSAPSLYAEEFVFCQQPNK